MLLAPMVPSQFYMSSSQSDPPMITNYCVHCNKEDPVVLNLHPWCQFKLFNHQATCFTFHLHPLLSVVGSNKAEAILDLVCMMEFLGGFVDEATTLCRMLRRAFELLWGILIRNRDFSCSTSWDNVLVNLFGLVPWMIRFLHIY